MTTKKVILIDDERLARVELKNMLAGFPQLEVIGEAANADEGVELIKQTNADLIFLDIHMPEKSGFDMLEELLYVPPVIFVTAYDEYAIKAFEFNALDYILKPIVKTRLATAIDHVFSKKENPPPAPTSAIAPYPDHLYLKDGAQTYFVKLQNISLFSSFGNYVKVHFEEQSVLVHRSLNQIEQRVPKDHFFRANRYSIVNIQQVQTITQLGKAKLMLTLANGYDIECSERKSILFREKWGI